MTLDDLEAIPLSSADVSAVVRYRAALEALSVELSDTDLSDTVLEFAALPPALLLKVAVLFR